MGAQVVRGTKCGVYNCVTERPEREREREKRMLGLGKNQNSQDVYYPKIRVYYTRFPFKKNIGSRV